MNLYTAGDKSSRNTECTITRLGYYWGLFYSTWVIVKVTELPNNGGTGCASSEDYIDYHGKHKPYGNNIACCNYKILAGDFNCLKEIKNSRPPSLDRQTLLDYGVSKLWVDKVK